jgi:hypothetical protein
MEFTVKPGSEGNETKKAIKNIICNYEIKDINDREIFSNKILSIISALDNGCDIKNISTYYVGKAYGMDNNISENFIIEEFYKKIENIDSQEGITLSKDNQSKVLFTITILPENTYVFMNGFLCSVLTIWFYVLGFYDINLTPNELEGFKIKNKIMYEYVNKIVDMI